MGRTVAEMLAPTPALESVSACRPPPLSRANAMASKSHGPVGLPGHCLTLDEVAETTPYP